MIRYAVLPFALVCSPLTAQSAPPLTDLRIVAVTSASQAERIAPDQQATAKRHDGAVTLIVRETGIGRARVLRLNGAVANRPSTTRPLCGAAVTPGACRSGESTTGVEITYHLGDLPPDTIVAVQDQSANLPAANLSAELVLR